MFSLPVRLALTSLLCTSLSLACGQETSESIAKESPADAAFDIPGGVAGSGTAFVRDRLSGIVAVALLDGTQRWRIDDVARPIGVREATVLGWESSKPRSNAILFVALDASTGRRIAVSNPVPLGEWVSTRPQRGGSFDLRAVADAAAPRTWRVTWEAESTYSGGAKRSRRQEMPTHRQARATLLVTVRDGAITVETLVSSPPPSLSTDLMTACVPYLRGSRQDDAPIRVDDVLVVLRNGPENGGLTPLTIARFAGGDARPLTPFVVNDAGIGPPRLTLDGAHLVLTREQGAQIVSLRTGSAVGAPRTQPVFDATVRGTTAYVAELPSVLDAIIGDMLPLELRAVDLDSGDVRWSIALEPVPAPESQEAR